MSGERTEEATPKKLRDARRRGEAWKSRDVTSAATLLAAALVLGWTGGELLDAHVQTFQLAIDAAAGRLAASPGAVLEASVALVARALAPLLVALVVVAAIGPFLQVGPLFSMRAIAWSPERLDPLAGARGLVSQRRAFELGKTLLVLLMIAGVAWWTLRDGMRGTLGLSTRGPLEALRAGGTLVRTMVLRAGGVMLAVAVLDVVYQRWRFLQDQRMTRREVEREQKDEGGDPASKQARERARRDSLRHSALEGARLAVVLVVRERELAVALKYDRERASSVPEVLARGQGELAARMIDAARASRVPIAEDAALAASLHPLAEGEPIPAAAYEPVAALLQRAWSERDR